MPKSTADISDEHHLNQNLKNSSSCSNQGISKSSNVFVFKNGWTTSSNVKNVPGNRLSEATLRAGKNQMYRVRPMSSSYQQIKKNRIKSGVLRQAQKAVRNDTNNLRSGEGHSRQTAQMPLQHHLNKIIHKPGDGSYVFRNNMTQQFRNSALRLT